VALAANDLRELSCLYDQWEGATALDRDALHARIVGERGDRFTQAFSTLVRAYEDAESRVNKNALPTGIRDAALAYVKAESRAGGAANTIDGTSTLRSDSNSSISNPRSHPLSTTTVFEAGDTVGPYELVRELGRGGMGVVWLAQRADGQHARQVALKMPLLTELDWVIAARFTRERNILAALEHPTIARLYDAGMHGAAQPYIALEYVQGVPIDDYVRNHSLRPERIVEIFIRVVEAVAYAHAQLVIHRDIKPSNILVDESGQPHLLDFGIAKLLDEDSATQVDATQLTRLSGRAFTLDYASPEQVNGLPLGTASDVYATGVVLFELLTGGRPYAPQGNTRRELEIAILENDIAKPSEHVLRVRTSDAQRTARRIRGDLDTVVLKALKKDPRQRYATAQAFADDLKRYLAFQPIAAKPDSTVYRLGRFVRRHRVAVTASLGLALAVVAGVAATFWQAQIAQAEAARADATNDFLFAAFAEAKPSSPNTASPTILKVTEDAIAKARVDKQMSAGVRVPLLSQLGEVLLEQGRVDEALTLFAENFADARARLGSRSKAALVAGTALARAQTIRGQTSESRALFETLLERSTHADASVRAAILASSGVLASKQLDSARALKESAEAFALCRTQCRIEDRIERGSEHANVLSTFNQHDEAMRIYVELDGLIQTRYGPEHMRRATLLGAMSKTTRLLGDAPTAVNYARQALAIDDAVIPKTDFRRSYHLYFLALALREMREFKSAFVALEESLAIEQAALGASHRDVAYTKNALASVALSMGDARIAVKYFDEAARLANDTQGARHSETLGMRARSAYALALAGETQKGTQLLDAVIAEMGTALGPAPNVYLEALERRAQLAIDEGDGALAEQMFENLAKVLERTPKAAAIWPAHLAVGRAWSASLQGRMTDAQTHIDAAETALRTLPQRPSVVGAQCALLKALTFDALGDARASDAVKRATHAYEELLSPDGRTQRLAEALNKRSNP
jgi:eukaryotic-like serine/threonine-protein kinase